MSDRSPVPLWSPPPPAITRLLFGALPLSAALGPLLSIYGGLFAYRIVCAGLIAYTVVFLMARSRWIGADVWLVLAAASFIVTGLVGLPSVTPGSDNPYSEFLAVVLGLLTALAARAWQRREPGLYLALCRGWVVAALVMCLVALAEVVTGAHLPGYLASAHPDPAASFGNPNSLAVFVVMANVWATPVRRHSSALWRLSTWVLVPATLAIALLTDARLATVVWLAIMGWSVVSGVRRSRHGLARVGEALLPLGAAFVLLAVAPTLLSLATESATAGSSGGVRADLTRIGLGFARDNHGLPTWPGSFEALMRDNVDTEAVGGLVNAHNVWVEILVQYGVPSLLLLLGWLLSCAVRRSGERDVAALGALAILLLGVVDSSFLDAPTLWLSVLTLAVVSRTCPRDPVVAGRPATAPPASHTVGAP